MAVLVASFAPFGARCVKGKDTMDALLQVVAASMACS